MTIGENGAFTYTPKNNKVGVDSFAYTATDPQGKVSREATVTVTILRPTEPTAYTDTFGRSCAFSAEWMRSTGIFAGETLAGSPCFFPEKNVTKGEFLTMVVKTLGKAAGGSEKGRRKTGKAQRARAAEAPGPSSEGG